MGIDNLLAPSAKWDPVNLTLHPRASITIECTSSEPKSYGPNLGDELCTLFTTHHAKGTLVDDGLWSQLHGGGARLDI